VARVGSCRKPPGALYTGSGKEGRTLLFFLSGRTSPLRICGGVGGFCAGGSARKASCSLGWFFHCDHAISRHIAHLLHDS